MISFDLEAELAAGAETPKRHIEHKQGGSKHTLSKYLASSKQSVNAPSPKVVGLVRRAVAIMDDGPEAAGKAARLLLKALNIDENFALANHAMALCLERLGRLSAALNFYEKAWELNPADSELYMNLAMVAWKLDMLDAAEKFLRLFLQMCPNRPSGIINLSGVLRDQGKFEDSIELLRAAIYHDAENPALWNSLATTLLESGDPKQSITFYTEALRIDPEFGRAHHNTAYAYELLGQPEKSAYHFNQALKAAETHNDKTIMNHGLSQALLALGQTKEGWDLYQTRLDAAYIHSTKFMIDAPRWDGADIAKIKGKRVLWVGEQGLGDEILFLQMAKDLQEAIGPEGELRISIEERLQGLAQQIAPHAIIGTYKTIRQEAKDIRFVFGFDDLEPCDIWTPLAQPARSLRLKPEDFPQEPFLFPAKSDIDHWKNQLAAIGTGLKVGVLWKSLKMDIRRSKHFSSFDHWRQVFDVPGIEFINLQYGETQDDIEYVRNKFSKEIHTLDEIDLKDDLEQVTALTKALDIVIGPTNATTNLAGAAGGNVWLIHPHGGIWTHMGMGRTPWYPTARSFIAEGYANWSQIMKDVAGALHETVKTKAVA